MASAVIAVVLGMMLFASAFIMFVNQMEEIKHERVHGSLLVVATILAILWLVLTVLGATTMATGFHQGFFVIFAHVV